MTEEERLAYIEDLKAQLHVLETQGTSQTHVHVTLTLEEVRMPLTTLQGALDNLLGYPKLILRKDGRHCWRTSRGMIEKGDVCVNGFRIRDVCHPMHEWDSIKFAYGRQNHFFTWKGLET